MDRKNNMIACGLAVALLVSLGGCEDEVQLPNQDESQYNQVYMPLAVNNPVAHTLTVADEPQELIYGANYGGRGYPEADIAVRFSVNQALVASFNEANGTDYELLPEGAYTLEAAEATIPKDELATQPLSLSVNTTGEGAVAMFKTYLLPLTVQSSFKVNEQLQTTYYLVTAEPDIADYPDYDRSAWEIVDFSSEEANGEGPNNGRAVFVLDGDNQTFWHSQWQGASPPPPHHLSVDMGEVTTLHGINTIARQVSGSGGKPEQVRVDVSLDNEHWDEIAVLTLSSSNSQQKTWLPEFVEARYFRLVILSANGSSHAHLAELGAY
ncbi:BT_3987 domain-containing protein [Parapedobacter sp. 2B3]|uniref:BT_3987 domain-containing protein n=1 Tax=Parapedobacter sp. 2B3 TaxID=3342381 RepID=UPI0035B68E5A